MSNTVYKCDTPGSIVPVTLSSEEDGFTLSQYFIVEKYEHLYEENIKRFNSVDTPYALPGKGKKVKPYYGFDREPMRYTPDNAKQFSFADISAAFRSLSEKDICEIIYEKIADSDADKPEGMSFLGYDVCYPLDSDGFSAICDCMFLCRWHGCDENGTEFLPEFESLNENGLFNSQEEAVCYLRHYLSQDWAETGEFCIVEIFR